MTTTTPTSGGLYLGKSAVARRSERLIRWLARRGVTAGQLTGASLATALVLGGLSGWSLTGNAPASAALVLLPLAALRLLTAVWDGQLARATGTDSRRGAVLAELADHVGDLVIVGALTVHNLALGVIAAGLVLLSELTITTCWAATGQRAFPGVGGKPDRTIGTALIASLALALPASAVTALIGLLVAVLVVNLLVRLRHAMRVTAVLDAGAER